MSAPLAVTMGDPCGIGPDLVLTAWVNQRQFGLPSFFVVGNRNVLLKRAELLQIELGIVEGSCPSSDLEKLHIVEIHECPKGSPGVPEAVDARAAIEAIDLAVKLTQDGVASGIVTGPINKKALYEVGFNHPGHTEYLAELVERESSKKIHPVMMIAGPQLRTVPVTIHIPLKEVVSNLTEELIVRSCKIVAEDLGRYFGIDSPRLAVSGLNPHAGESGSLGIEDQEIVSPAVKALQRSGIKVVGPLPADTMFHAAARSTYDAAICMYHDQALIPAKTIGFDDAVNVTLGLPFIRTSPDHGTAYDIAGTGKANPSSFVAAIRLAGDMAGRK